MNTFSQWLHQHDFLLLIVIILGGSAIVLSWRRHWTKGRFLAWSVLVVVAVTTLWGLRTPPVSISEPEVASAANDFNPPQDIAPSPIGYTELSLDSVEAIQATLSNSDKPTLVEIYSDYGIS
jgi:hypothetical protein